MATYCGHSNAPAEYALKEEESPPTARASHSVYGRHCARYIFIYVLSYYVYIAYTVVVVQLMKLNWMKYIITILQISIQLYHSSMRIQSTM